MEGTVKWFSGEKGFGFVVPSDGSKDCFAHFSEIKGTGFKSLAEGEKVSFDIAHTEKGRKATNIVKLAK